MTPSPQFLIGDRSGSAPGILCLDPNSIGSLRLKTVSTEIIYVPVPGKPYQSTCYFDTGNTLLGILFLITGRHSFHSSTWWPTCTKERRNG
ncbi:hypothetical protein TNCV_2017441 [Trichonephila clavipes]|nr:hypothetical protein TNCV_2017441 [Trichonephila clavipes]